MKLKYFKVNFFIIFLLFNLNLFSKSVFDDTFEKKIVFEKSKLTPQELFAILSQQLEIKFLYKGENDFTIAVEEVQNLPAKMILSILEDFSFDFYIKFDEDKPYIFVKIKDSFKEKTQKKVTNKQNIDVNLEGVSLKDIFYTLEKLTGKKFEIKRTEILEKRTNLKLEDIEWVEFLKILSAEFGFNYEIKEDIIRIW